MSSNTCCSTEVGGRDVLCAPPHGCSSQTIARGSTYQSLAAFHKLAVEEDMPRVWKSAACAAVRHDDSPRWRVDDASRDHAKGGAHERRKEPGEG